MKQRLPNIVLAVLCLIFAGSSKAQQQPLDPGDEVPDEFWRATVQTVSLKKGIRQSSLQEISKRAIILEFGSTYCKPCLASLADLDTLKDQFPNQLTIIGVTNEKSSYVLSFLKKRSFNWTYIAENTLFREKLFPYVTFPHLVWIKDKRVVAITDKNKVTLENLQRFVNGDLSLPRKTDLTGIDHSLPLMLSGFPQINQKLVFQSAITDHIPGIAARNSVLPVKNEFDRKLIQLKFTNHNLLGLFTSAFSPLYFQNETIYNNRIIWEVPDSVKFKMFPNQKLKGDDLHRWYSSYGYCYNLVVPSAFSREKMYTIMRDELNHFTEAMWGIRGRVERRQIKALVLIQTGYQSFSKPVTTTQSRSVLDKQTRQFSMQNRPLSSLALTLALQYQDLPTPIIPELNINDTLDIQLNLTDDIAQVKAQLNNYGLDLIERVVDINMLLIYPKP